MKLLTRPRDPRRPAGPVGVAVRVAAAGLSRRAFRRAARHRRRAPRSRRRACGGDAGTHGRGVARTRPDARRGRLRRNLRPATAIHDVPDLLDRRRHPQPRPGDAAFAQAYRDAGSRPPVDEAPDHLPVVLEFAATVDPVAGRRLLVEHRVPIDVLRDALTESGSPYAHTISGVCETIPAATDQEVRRAQRLAQAGPPAEAVGLQPFTLTVPPRRTEGDR